MLTVPTRYLRSAPAILGLCVVILFLRKPDQFINPQFWAEDGVFYHSWYVQGWGAFIEPYAGYLHTLPRLVAATCWFVDPAYAPHWFVGCAGAATLYVCSRALSLRIPIGRGPILALAVVLVPDAFEVLLNVANLQWLVASGFILLLISRDPTGWFSYLHDIVAAVIAGLTGPFSVLLAPLFLWRAFIRDTRASWILAATVGFTAAVQINFITAYKEPPTAPAQISYRDGISAIGTRLSGSLLTGARIDQNSPELARWAFAALTLALAAATVIRRTATDQQDSKTSIFLASAFLLLLAASLYRCRWVLAELPRSNYGSRYFFPLQLILLWLVISNLSDTKRSWRWSAATVLIISLAMNFTRLREGALLDLRWAAYAPKIRAGEAVTIPINPGGSWRIPLPARPVR